MNLKEKFESVLADDHLPSVPYVSRSSNVNISEPKHSGWKKILQVFVIAIVIAFLCSIIYMKECFTNKFNDEIKNKLENSLQMFREKEEEKENIEEEEEIDPLFQRF